MESIKYHFSKILFYRDIIGILFFSFAAIIVFIQHSFNILHLFIIPSIIPNTIALVRGLKSLKEIELSKEKVILVLFNNHKNIEDINELKEIRQLEKKHFFSYDNFEIKFNNQLYKVRGDSFFEQFLMNNKDYFKSVNVNIEK